MSIAQSMLPELDNEMATTRRVLERVPFDKADWKPHQKSFSMLQLASHIADMAGWMTATVHTDSLDLAPPDGPKWEPPPPPKDSAELLARFDKAVAEGREALAGCSDEAMMQTWSLLQGGQPMFSMPRVATIRGMLMNHMVHHRGQLSVYLRMNDVPVPSIYGPSADEQGPS